MGSSNDPEEQLVAACIAGKPGALDELLERYSEAIEAGVIKAISSQTSVHVSADVEDLCQDFRMALVRRPKKFLGPFTAARGPLDRWIFIVSDHFTLKRLLSKQIRWPVGTVHFQADELEDLPDDTGDALSDTELITRLLDALDEDLRTVIQAHFGLAPFERSLNAHEIGERLGCSVPTVYRRVNDALAILRIHAKALQDEQG